jgi:hypothetical protein
MLLNVRLKKEEIRAVKGLRRAKVNVSALVRRALREAAPRGKVASPSRAALVGEVLAAFPSSREAVKRPRLDDRRAVSVFIARKLSAR